MICFGFDLPYLVGRAKKLKTKLDWGRSGGFLRSRPSRLQIAEKTIDYPKFTIDGRHFVDTFLLAQFYDVGMRSLAGFERMDVARHFDLCDSEEIFGAYRQRTGARVSRRIQKRSGDARYAAFEKRVRYRTCSARATSSRRRFFHTITRT